VRRIQRPRSKSLTVRYTDVARTFAVTAGHTMALFGTVAREVGFPGGRTMERAGDAVAERAVKQCSRDTPRLDRCNGRGNRER
jgi:NAD(P)H-hydrate repair Nnr-like enzyme with NAD(P)H-hydrate epimerase domain